jgi:hypothetical protein
MDDCVWLFADAWKLMVTRLPSSSIKEEDGVVSCFGNVPLILLNVSIVDRPAETHDELREILNTASRHAATCPYPSCVLVREDWLPAGWAALAEEARLTPIVPMTSMEANELLPPRRPPANLDVRLVTNDAMGQDLARLNALAYQMPVEAFDCIANMRLWHADSYAYVGYVNGSAVSCAAALPVSGTVYIALVATLPGEQGKGYAETVMRHAVIQGQQAMKTTRTTLHASDMGLPLYRAMGYRPGPRMVMLRFV